MSESNNKRNTKKQSKDERIAEFEDRDKQLSKAFQDIQESIKIQKNDGNWNYDPYMHGLLNGMIMVESIIKNDSNPEFYEAPERWKYKRWYQKILPWIKRILGIKGK
jgi:hypothetical protein